MKIMNNRLHSRMGYQCMDDSLIIFIGKDISRSINKKL